MELLQKVVDEIKKLLLDTRNVPLPGGHGYWFQELRQLHPTQVFKPTVPERCAVAVVMLGCDDAYGRFIRKGWVPIAIDWFDRNGSEELTASVGELRWQYLLAAMSALGSTVLSMADLDVEAARNRINEYRKTQRREARRKATAALAATAEPAAAGQAQDQTVPGVDYTRKSSDDVRSAAERAWGAAADALNGSNRDVALMLYTMHTLHANLGVPQYSMAAKGDERTKFYLYVAEMLGAVNVPGCAVCEVAGRVQRALKASRACGAQTSSTTYRLLEATLPSCFQPAHRHSGVPQRDTVKLRLRDDESALRLLLAAHDLADALADRLVDPLWWVELPERDRNVLEGHLILLDHIVKYGADRYARDSSAGDLPWHDDERASRYVCLQPHDAFEHFQNLTKAAQLGVDKLRQRRSWTLKLTAQSCSICLRHGHEVGVSR